MSDLLDIGKNTLKKAGEKEKERLQPLFDVFGVDTWAKLKSAIAKVDRKIGKEVAQKNTITDAQITAILEKADRKTQNKQELKEYGKELGSRLAERALDKILDKKLKVSNEDGTFEVGTGIQQPPPNENKIPVGVWIALALVLLVFIAFMVVKFVIKK